MPTIWLVNKTAGRTLVRRLSTHNSIDSIYVRSLRMWIGIETHNQRAGHWRGAVAGDCIPSRLRMGDLDEDMAVVYG